MTGQGCPIIGFPFKPGIKLSLIFCRFAYCLAVVLQFYSASSTWAAAGDEVEARFRITWGAGINRVFTGQIAIDHGTVTNPRCLGLQNDSPGSILQSSAQSVQVFPTMPTSFGGLDITIRGNVGSRLIVAIDSSTTSSSSAPGPTSQKSWTLEELLHERQSANLDAFGNRIVIERVPTDRIRIHLNSPHMIFDPGERVTFDVSGYRTGLPANGYRLLVQLVNSGSGETLYQENHSINVDAQGDVPLFSPSPITMPDRSGVYEVRLQIQPKRTLSNLVHTTPLLERKIQFVVVDKNPIANDLTPWQVLERIDLLSATKPTTLTALAKIPEIPWLPSNKRMATSEPPTAKRIGELDTLQLGPQQWHAVSLNSLEVGKPHLLVVRVASSASMQLSVSVLDRNGAGEVLPISLDTGLALKAKTEERSPNLEEHAVMFWPKSDSPTILLYNPHHQSPANVMSMEIRSGPEHLSATTKPINDLARHSSNQNTLPKSDSIAKNPEADRRLIALHLDKPILPEAFGGREATDPDTGRVMDDWSTFYHSANRLSEYCRWAGYNGAVVSVHCEGSGLYPSSILTPTPRFDSGVFFSDGRDPVTKDVVELLARIFDRDGLQLVVSLDLTCPIPELEPERRFGLSRQSSVDQVNSQGESWPGADGQTASKLPRYNPLDRRFQSVMERVVDELNDRYARHTSWRGIAFRLGSTSHLNFGGDRWGFDSGTIRSYEEALQIRLPQDPTQRAELLQGSEQGSWLRWRAGQLASFYESIGKRIRNHNRDAKLFLLTSGLFDEPPAVQGFTEPYSATHDPLSAMLAYGIDLEQLATKPNVMPLRGESIQPLESIVQQRWSLETANDRRLDRAFAIGALSGGQLFQQPKGFPIPSLNQRNPFGATKTQAWLFPHVHAQTAVARHQILRRLAADDCLALIQGGWLPTFGQELETRDLLVTLAQLPALKLPSLPSRTGKENNSNLVVRYGIVDGQAYLVILNVAPWSEEVQVNWSGTTIINPTWLSETPAVTTAPNPNGLLAWNIPIAAYQMLACRWNSGDRYMESWTHQADPQAKKQLEVQLNLLADQITRAVDQSRATGGLTNGDFESSSENATMPAEWIASLLPTATIKLDTREPRSGSQCLRIENRSDSNASAWIQSTPLPIPRTGRLAAQISVRFAPGPTRPNVRLTLTGRTTDGKRFDRSQYLASSNVSPQVNVENVSANSSGWIDFKRPLMRDIAPDGLTQLQLSVDVEGLGTVWIDNVRIMDLFLLDDERSDLRDKLFIARDELKNNHLSASLRLLDSYWAEYLMQFDPSDNPAANGFFSAADGKIAKSGAFDGEGDTNALTANQSKGQSSAEENRNWLQRFRDGVRRPWFR